MAKLNEAVQGVPLDPGFGDAAIGNSIDADEVGRKRAARGGKGAHWTALGSVAMRMNSHFVAFGDEKIDSLARVGKCFVLGGEVFAQLVASANLRLAEGAAVTDEIGRDEFIEARPVLAVNGFYERRD